MTISTSADTPVSHEQRHDLARNEAIQTITKQMPGPASHGANGKFVLDDTYRPLDTIRELYDLDDATRFRDGGLYQHARGSWYDAKENCDVVTDPNGKEYHVLTREYSYSDGEETYAVTHRSSRWMAGTGEGDDYRPWFKYDITLQALDDEGNIKWESTPTKSLNVKIRPQYDDLVYKDGSSLRPPNGEGSLVSVKSTWITEAKELFERAAHLLGDVLNYGISWSDVVEDSTTVNKAEVHHRFTEEREGDVAHTLRQSAELMASHGSDLNTRGVHENDRWMEVKIRSQDWENLGFPNIDVPILIKLYYADNAEYNEYPMDQPKLEAALDGKETVVDENGHTTQRGIPWDRWDEIMAVLEEILLSHLTWADVGAEDLVADDHSAGPNAEPVTFEHPEGRRHWLRKHYQSLVPELYREATKVQTELIYDILDIVRRDQVVTYDRLVKETGAANRTIRRHVRRLAEDIGGDEAGILDRKRSTETLVSFSSRYFQEQADDALNTINPTDTPEDRRGRADGRREIRMLRQTLNSESDADPEDVAQLLADLEEHVDADLADDQEETTGRKSVWRYFSDVSIGPHQLADALEHEYIADDDVRVRVDGTPLFGPPG